MLADAVGNSAHESKSPVESTTRNPRKTRVKQTSSADSGSRKQRPVEGSANTHRRLTSSAEGTSQTRDSDNLNRKYIMVFNNNMNRSEAPDTKEARRKRRIAHELRVGHSSGFRKTRPIATEPFARTSQGVPSETREFALLKYNEQWSGGEQRRRRRRRRGGYAFRVDAASRVGARSQLTETASTTCSVARTCRSERRAIECGTGGGKGGARAFIYLVDAAKY
ncbi:hypothetical protein B0H19DRAFT_1069438 [Mycena capillaripes]|nr:hypothetical protein B0H19DRAFT_1069438 [Mycena capillaripes]